jgi:hypothetical protein
MESNNVNLQDQARDLLQNLDSRLSASAYDVAWVARIRSEGGELLWPEMTEWLLDHQWEDGSWGDLP